MCNKRMSSRSFERANSETAETLFIIGPNVRREWGEGGNRRCDDVSRFGSQSAPSSSQVNIFIIGRFCLLVEPHVTAARVMVGDTTILA